MHFKFFLVLEILRKLSEFQGKFIKLPSDKDFLFKFLMIRQFSFLQLRFPNNFDVVLHKD